MRRTALIIFLILFACAQKPAYTETRAEHGEIRLDTTELAAGEVAFYSFHMGGKRFDFFLQKLGADDIQSYIDACFKCAPQRKGFTVREQRLYCGACGESFPLDKLNGIGSCYPIKLPGDLRDGIYIIKVQDLTRKMKYPL